MPAAPRAVPPPLLVSSVEGKLASRFGTGTFIGAVVDLEVEGNVRWDTESVVAIPHAEYERFAREYDGLIREGALVVHKAPPAAEADPPKAASGPKSTSRSAAKE